MTGQFAEVAGTPIRYEALGEGTPVILVPARDLVIWDDQMEPFAGRHRVIRFDVRGRGSTTNPPRRQSDHDDLRALLSHLEIAQAALVGFSGGGKVALDFAVLLPDMVDKLVLVSPGLGGYEWTHAGWADTAEVMTDAYRRGDQEQAAELWTQIWVDGPSRALGQVDPSVRSRVYHMVLRTIRMPEGEGERQEIDPPAIERLGDIQAPALVILGEHDVADIHAIGELLINGIPDARLVEMEDVGHFLNMEKPAEFNRLVLDFL